MERLVTDSFRAVGSKIDPKRVSNCFEIFGYDFMIDENFKVFLIEANTNPCLEICSPLLARIIPELLDNSFRIAIDPLFQPSQFLAKLKDDANQPTQTSNNESHKIESQRDTSVGAAAEGDHGLSPHYKAKLTAKDSIQTPSSNTNNQQQKRQRLELLTQIKYTLIYDERIDQPIVDKILADYEKRLVNSAAAANPQSVQDEGLANPQPQEGSESTIQTTLPQFANSNTVNQKREGDAAAIGDDGDALQLLREIVEEEKLDEQAAKKEEIEAAEDEAAGIMPQPLMLMQPGHHVGIISDDEDDDLESEDEYF